IGSTCSHVLDESSAQGTFCPVCLLGSHRESLERSSSRMTARSPGTMSANSLATRRDVLSGSMPGSDMLVEVSTMTTTSAERASAAGSAEGRRAQTAIATRMRELGIRKSVPEHTTFWLFYRVLKNASQECLCSQECCVKNAVPQKLLSEPTHCDQNRVQLRF